MKYLVIYDKIGTIINMRSGFPLPKEPIGIPFMWVEIPTKKRLTKIDTSTEPHQAIFENIPKSKEEIQKETFTKTLANLNIENKKKDTLIENLAQQINSLNIKIKEMEVK